MQAEYRVTAQETWDAIAESFNTIRNRPWHFCLEFIRTLKKTDKVADLGCGNGRHLFSCARRCSYVYGVDISSRLLRIVEKKIHNQALENVSLTHADVVHLPFKDESFEAVLFIASLHNIKGKDHRSTALQEVYRVLKIHGIALISVWSRWQDKFFTQSLRQTLIHQRTRGDVIISWKQHNLNIPRFYHLYGKNEFLREIKTANFHIDQFITLKIHSKRLADNYAVVVRKR